MTLWQAAHNGMSPEQLEKFMLQFGGQLDEATRTRMLGDLARARATPPQEPFDQTIDAVSKAVTCTFNWNKMPADPQTFGDWSKQYIEGMDAIKIVMEFLQAQEGMDLFSTNRAAKQLYQTIIRVGVEKVILNR